MLNTLANTSVQNVIRHTLGWRKVSLTEAHLNTHIMCSVINWQVGKFSRLPKYEHEWARALSAPRTAAGDVLYYCLFKTAVYSSLVWNGPVHNIFLWGLFFMVTETICKHWFLYCLLILMQNKKARDTLASFIKCLLGVLYVRDAGCFCWVFLCVLARVCVYLYWISVPGVCRAVKGQW